MYTYLHLKRDILDNFILLFLFVRIEILFLPINFKGKYNIDHANIGIQKMSRDKMTCQLHVTLQKITRLRYFKVAMEHIEVYWTSNVQQMNVIAELKILRYLQLHLSSI